MRVSETEMTLENPFNIKQYPILDVDCVEMEEIDGYSHTRWGEMTKNDTGLDGVEEK